MKVDDGGPAFPRTQELWEGSKVVEGMSLRAWFAGMALQGLLSGNNPSLNAFDPMDTVVEVALEYADAMVSALKEKK